MKNRKKKNWKKNLQKKDVMKITQPDLNISKDFHKIHLEVIDILFGFNVFWFIEIIFLLFR